MRASCCVAALISLFTIPASGEVQTEPFVVTVPGRGWQIHLEAPPLSNFAGQTKGENFMFQAAGAGGFNVSAFVEVPKADGTGHEACFDHYWPLAKRSPLVDQASVKVVKSAKYVKVSYRINQLGGANGKANIHVHYYMAHEGRWLDVHASQSPAREDEGLLFEAFEKGLSCSPAKARPGSR